MSLIKLDKENFNELIKNKVLVDFYADWCGPCKMIAPILDEISNDFDIIKVNVDKHPSIAQQYKVMSIPTLIVFNEGEVVTTKVGFLPKEEIIKLMED